MANMYRITYMPLSMSGERESNLTWWLLKSTDDLDMRRIIPVLFSVLSLVVFFSTVNAQTIEDLRHGLQLQSHSLHIDGNSIAGSLKLSDSALHIDENSIVGSLPLDPSIRIHGNNFSSGHTEKHFVEKDNRRYYIDVIPPEKHAKQVDHSHLWLLGTK